MIIIPKPKYDQREETRLQKKIKNILRKSS